MDKTHKSKEKLIPHLFRREYTKMTAVLCRHFGLQHIETAEDIISETFLKAEETWPIKGIPENPTGWLYTVAANKTKDYLKQLSIFTIKVKNNIKEDIEESPEWNINFEKEPINDNLLSMMFAICNPANSTDLQICLALNILCGFSSKEIASALLIKNETVKKRFYRAKENLRISHFKIGILSKNVIKERFDTVLKIIYLLFNEGYYSKTGNSFIKKELCLESIRLALLLTENQNTNIPQTNALLALMCYQCSRLDARINLFGEMVLFEEQDQKLWNRELIEKGNYFLTHTYTNEEISKYHLEAAIAYWHTTGNERKKWSSILTLYNHLITMDPSPIANLNRIFVLSKVYGCKKAIAEAEKISLQDNNSYQILLGYLYSKEDIQKAIYHYQKAIKLSQSLQEKKILEKKLAALTSH